MIILFFKVKNISPFIITKLINLKTDFNISLHLIFLSLLILTPPFSKDALNLDCSSFSIIFSFLLGPGFSNKKVHWDHLEEIPRDIENLKISTNITSFKQPWEEHFFYLFVYKYPLQKFQVENCQSSLLSPPES